MNPVSVSEPTFKILSIDGGGIRGLYSAKLLEIFENRFGCNIVDYFDMICGTSTGGLIALGLSLGKPATEIVKFYYNEGTSVFPPANKFVATLKQLAGGGKYSNDNLRTALTQVLGDKKIKDAKCLLCIPSHSVTHARPYIFKRDHAEGNLGRDNETFMVDVALATSAAPTYFPIVEIPNHPGQFIDGGVCANNPTLVGLLEAIKYFVGPNKRFSSAKILSIETLSPASGRLLSTRKSKSVLSWREDLVGVFSEGQARMTSFTMKQLCESGFIPCEYVRIPCPDVSPTQAPLLTLDNASKSALDLLASAGADQGHLYAVKEEIKKFFNSKKQYIV